MPFSDLQKISEDNPNIKFGLFAIPLGWAGIMFLAPVLGFNVPVIILQIGWIASASLFAAGVLFLLRGIVDAYRQSTAPQEITDGIIIIEGHSQALPTHCPPEEIIHILDLQHSPGEGLTGVGLSTRRGNAYGDMSWMDLKECVKFTVKNYSDQAAVTIQMHMDVSYQETIDIGDGGIRSGDVVKSMSYSIPISGLKKNADDEFVFYTYNLSPYFVSFYPNEECVIGRLGDMKNLKTKVSVSTGLPGKMNFFLQPYRGKFS